MVKAGYKQTEIGLIPVDWEVKSLFDNSDLITKGTTPNKFSNNGVNFVKIESFVNNKIILDKCLFVDERIHNNYLKRSILEENDILFAIAGATIGKTAVVYKSILPANTNQALAIIRLKKHINYKYVYSILKSNLMTEFINENAIGGAQPNLNLQQVGAFKIPLPPLPEQTAIAEALSDADAWIERLEQLIAKKRLLKQGAMQTLLTPPSHAEPDEAWEVKKLGEVCEFKNGAAHENVVDENGEYIIVNSKFISQEGNVRKYSNAFLCPLYKDEIVMVMSDIPNGKALAKCYIIEENNKYTLNQRICAFYPKQNFDSMFLYYKINRNEYFLSFDSGSGQTNLRKDEVLNCPIDFPNYQEQTRIATILSDMDAELEALEAQLQKAKQMKQGMMQELLTGRTRLV